MAELAPVLTNCHVCRDPKVELINGWMKAGVPDLQIETRLREAGTPYTRKTLGKHRRQHLMTDFNRQREDAARRMRKQQRTIKGPKNRDLAVLIRDAVVERVDNGELDPTISDGLRAQAMLDARAEKGADRDLILQLAQVLGGAVPMLPSATIEGEYAVIDEEAAEDEAAFALLGSGV